MKAFIVGSIALSSFLAAHGAFAQVLKQEPASGTLATGKTVLVDDGTCGPGKIKQVTGGSNQSGNPVKRSTSCIPKK